MTMKELTFHFSKTTQQDVVIHIASYTDVLLPVLTSIAPDKVFIVCDNHVDSLYSESVEKLIRSKYMTSKLVHPADEAHKNWIEMGKISELFFENGGTSKSCVITLGGGLTGNIAGLFASLAFRGLPMIHIPTTLLAQVDSAVDVKQSINTANLKNAIGSYKTPNAVIIDSSFLNTLSDRELRAGFAEAIKHGFAQDVKFAEFIVQSRGTRDRHILESIATRAIELKIEHWQNTPTMWNDIQKVERLTHLGHTIGKVLEMISVDYFTHGEAIAHGMVIEAYMAHILGYLDEASVNRIRVMLKDLSLLFPLSEACTPERIADELYANGQAPMFALLQGLGNPETISIQPDRQVVADALEWYFNP